MVVLLLPGGKAHILLPFSAGEANRGRGSRPPSRLLSSRPCARRRAVRARRGRKGPCHPAALPSPGWRLCALRGSPPGEPGTQTQSAGPCLLTPAALSSVRENLDSP